MTTTAIAARKDAVRDAKRTMILDAALEVFERDGLDGASMRAIAGVAGYTAPAIYFHFESKEAIYAELLNRSLDALIACVEAAAPADRSARERFEAAALAFFDFYAANPRDLDLGFYLFRGGVRPHGISPETDKVLNAKLLRSLAPLGDAARELGLGNARAQAIVGDTFAHAVGLLIMEHTGRLRLFRAKARKLMQEQVARLLDDLEDGT